MKDRLHALAFRRSTNTPVIVRAQTQQDIASVHVWKQPLILTLVVLSLGTIFGPALVAHMQLSAQPFAFNDDVRQQIYPFLRYYSPGVFPDDYAARYYLDCFPLGFRALYTALATVVNPVLVSKVVPYLLFGVLLAALGMASYRLSGMIGCWFTLAFSLSSPYFLARLAGGLPRSFGIALLACVLAALVLGRIRWLAALTVVSAAFYAPAAVLAGLSLGTVLLVLPRPDRGEATSWSTRRRYATVAVTMVACVAILLPTVLAARAYGRTLGPADIATYPELGPNGRYGPEDRAPFDALPTALLKMIPEAFRGGETTTTPDDIPSWTPGTYDWIATIPPDLRSMPLLQWVMLGICTVIAAGLLLQASRMAAARRALVLLGVACGAYLVAAPLAPTLYLPQRYTAYTIPLIAVVGLPAAVRTLTNVTLRSKVRPRISGATIAIVCGAVLLYTGGTGDRTAGLIEALDSDAAIYRFVASTPPDTLFAAWPSELANNVPYFGHRSILINAEVHQVFHQRYADEMRTRMNALIAAYLAADVAPLRALREQYAVRYLIIDDRHFTRSLPLYFAPYNQQILDALAALRGDGRGAYVRQLEERAGVFRDRSLVVIDLERID
jgi:hypothetical protein